MRIEHLEESKGKSVELTVDQVHGLRSLGEKLASKAGWWGEDDEEESRPKSVIDVTQGSSGSWVVLVREAVGVISVDELQLVVAPKIAYEHFLYLAAESGVVPRIEAQATQIESAESLWEIVAHWFVHAAERVVRGELAKGYRETTDDLERSRGRILPLETTQAFYRGRPVLACEFEEFSEDIAINRLLKAGCDLVASSAILDRNLRHRARVALARMTDVGPLQYADFRVEVDRLTYRYRDAISFAKVLLRNAGTTISHGAAHGWCFLIRTPDLVESGVRAVLRRHLAGRWIVHKKGKALAGVGFTLNPDLVFDRGAAVGDVKYKIFSAEWSRADLYQAVAFAAGYESDCSVVVGFKKTELSELPPHVQFGRINVVPLAWDASPLSIPEDAGARLSAAVDAYLSQVLRGGRQLNVA